MYALYLTDEDLSGVLPEEVPQQETLELQEQGPASHTWRIVAGVLCFVLASWILWLDLMTESDLYHMHMFGGFLVSFLLIFGGMWFLFPNALKRSKDVTVIDSDIEDAFPQGILFCPYCGAGVELSEEETATREFSCPECSNRVKLDTIS